MAEAFDSDVVLPEEAKTHLERAYEYQEQDLFSEALAECALVLELVPDCAEGHNLRGVLLEELGQIERAIDAYRMAIQCGATFPEARENLREAELIWKKTQRILARGPLAGFWWRVFAFGIDYLILVLPLLLVGMFVIPDIAVSMGPWGRFIGIGVMTLYFGWGNSFMSHGQTIGKRLLKIVVVDATGKYLSIGKSMARSLLLALMFLTRDWALPPLRIPLLQVVLSGIVSGFVLATVYGLVFNRITRQGIHDLCVGSYVVMSARRTDVSFPSCPLSYKRVTFGLIVISLLLVSGSALSPQIRIALGLIEKEEWDHMMSLIELLRGEIDVFSVKVISVEERVIGTPQVTEMLNIEVWSKLLCRRDLPGCRKQMFEIAHHVLDGYASLDEFAGLRISIMSRFDWGLATGKWTYRKAYPLDVWREWQNANAQ